MTLCSGGMNFCVWLSILGIEAGDVTGPWLFAAFGFFLSIPFFFGMFRLLSIGNPRIEKLYDKAVGADRVPDTRFVPHWFMLKAALLLIGAILYAIVMGIMSFIKD
jgi:hypothetical protein